ncbi:UNVERIFIED_CONTAM: hypothetical protein FKN15_073095 [Acipenser sinensis]
MNREWSDSFTVDIEEESFSSRGELLSETLPLKTVLVKAFAQPRPFEEAGVTVRMLGLREPRRAMNREWSDSFTVDIEEESFSSRGELLSETLPLKTVLVKAFAQPRPFEEAGVTVRMLGLREPRKEDRASPTN